MLPLPSISHEGPAATSHQGGHANKDDCHEMLAREHRPCGLARQGNIIILNIIRQCTPQMRCRTHALTWSEIHASLIRHWVLLLPPLGETLCPHTTIIYRDGQKARHFLKGQVNMRFFSSRDDICPRWHLAYCCGPCLCFVCLCLFVGGAALSRFPAWVCCRCSRFLSLVPVLEGEREGGKQGLNGEGRREGEE